MYALKVDLRAVLKCLRTIKFNEGNMDQKFWLLATSCKQVKEIAKIVDFDHSEARLATHGTIGKPDFHCGFNRSQR